MEFQRTEALVVGSGPGGATVARALATAGISVTIVERGKDWRRNPIYGTYAGGMAYSEKGTFLSSQEGLSIIRPMMVGGATSMYCGCAALPLPWWREEYGIEIMPYAQQIVDELNIAPLPAEQRGLASTRIAAAGAEIGQSWFPQPKFIFPSRAKSFDCGAKCMLGCRCQAKWHAGEYVDDAVAAGAILLTNAKVERVLIEDGRAVGVAGKLGAKSFSLQADLLILAAGGIGTPRILQRSGLPGAGQGMTMDTTVMAYGHAPYKGNGDEPPMSWSYADDELGVLYSTLIDPWLNYPVVLAKKGLGFSSSWHRWGHTLGVMIKLKDEISGGVFGKGVICKGLTAGDRTRLRQAELVAGNILRHAGCRPDSIFATPLRGTHPSGTVRIGDLLDMNLQSEIENLYVCDASVFPQALARPTVLTIMALANRLAAHLLDGKLA